MSLKISVIVDVIMFDFIMNTFMVVLVLWLTFILIPFTTIKMLGL